RHTATPGYKVVITRTPRTTIYPYTTLFRSNREEKIEKEIELNKKIFSTKLLDSALDKAVFKMKQSISEKSRELSEDEKNEIIFEDRKSTRLNSSHVSISYAVFCLKKKK